MEKMKKIISPIALNCLTEALNNIYWYKKDLKLFLSQILSDPYIISKLNWDDYKRNIATQLVSFLSVNQSKYKDDLITLMIEISKMSDFSHLAALEDGKAKVTKAKSAVDALKKQIEGHVDIVEEKKKYEERKVSAEERIAKSTGVQKSLEEIKNLFFQLISDTNSQSRGYKLEKIIKDLFDVFDLDPKASFKIQGEQIDGAFTFDNTDYLFEAKWQNALCDIADLDAFNGKVTRKLDNTLGLFCSINGYAPTAINAYSTGRRIIILMDGADIMSVLEGRIELPHLLLRKRRHAAQTGNIYLKVADILLEQ